MDGKPVKVTWTREDDLHHDLLPHGLGGAPRGGRRRAGQAGRLAAPERRPDDHLDLRRRREAGGDRSSSAWASSTCPFAIPNVRIENPEATAHTRIGWFRSVSNIPHAFAVQSFVAELAAAAGRDQKDFLLEVIGPARWITPTTLSDTWNHGESPERYPVDTGRLRRVVETAAREAGGAETMPKGRGLGIAAHYSFVTLRGGGRGGRGRRQGRPDDPARGHRGGLRRDRQPGPRARADGGRVRDGARHRDARARSASRPAGPSRTTSTPTR